MQKSKENMIPYGAREKMPFWYVLAFSTKGISFGICMCLSAYLVFYCTDVLGLNASVVGAIMIASKLLDALTDIVAGTIVDRTHSKMGKGRPYDLFIIPMWIFTILMFSVPYVSENIEYVYLFVMYFLVNAVCSTMVGAADAVYTVHTFTTEKNRILATTVSALMTTLMALIIAIALPILVNNAGADRSQWTRLTIVLGIPCMIIGMLRFIICKEIPEKTGGSAEKKKKSPGFRTMIGVLLKNRYAVLFWLIVLLETITNNARSDTYWFKYIYGNLSMYSTVGAVGFLAPVAIAFFPVVQKKAGLSKTLKLISFLGLLGYAVRRVGGVNLGTLLIGTGASTIAFTLISSMANVYMMDIMDYGEWKTGVRVEGLVASINNFMSKAAAAIGSGVLGFVMGVAGYDGLAAAQTESANQAIKFMFSDFELLLLAAAFILSLFYNIDKERPQMEKDLKARRSGK